MVKVKDGESIILKKNGVIYVIWPRLSLETVHPLPNSVTAANNR